MLSRQELLPAREDRGGRVGDEVFPVEEHRAKRGGLITCSEVPILANMNM